MHPELNQQLPTLRSQLSWLLAMVFVYLLLAPRFGIDAPVVRVLLNAFSLAVWLALLVAVFVPLERLFALNRQPILRPQLLVDIGYYFLTGLTRTLVLAFPIAVLALISRSVLPSDYTASVASLPIGIKIVAALVIGEMGFYWAHRAMHEVPALWKYHAPHHEPVRMDWLINSRAHPIDIIFTRLCGLALVAISGFGSVGASNGEGDTITIHLPLRSLGFDQDWAIVFTVFQVVSFVAVFWAFLIHANVKWRFGPLEQIFSSPHFHHWHHSRDDHPNHNYASMLPFFDRLFGTYHMPPNAWPPTYGIAPENSPEALIAAQQEAKARA